MADIIQRMGFDSSQALEQIALLNQALQSLNTLLGNTGAAVGQWNSVGTAAVSQFNSMRTAADAARKAIEALSNAQSKAATDAARVNAAPSKVNTPAPAPNMTAYLQQIEKLGDSLGAIPQKASEASKRGYASAQASLAQFAQANTLSLQQVSAAWNNNGTVVTGNANKVANLAQQVKNAHQQMAQSAQQSTTSFGLSWQQMMQVIVGTGLHMLIRGFISLLREAVVEAVDFGKRVAEVITISGQPFKSTQQDITNLGNTLIEMSNKYGQSASTIAEGYYQELSARVGTATESLYVLDQAMKLSIATNTSAAGADKLLTATLNSYGLAAGEAARVSDILFQSVTTGRYHMEELANLIGRVYPIAHEMGIGLEEVMAAINTMTVAGVSSDTAFTQLRGIFTQLLKPTKELKDLMQSKWGVENAQQAISLFGGLIPLLEALSKEAGGSSSEMAEFFKNVRALTGVLQTTNGHIDRLKTNFEELKNVGQGVTDWAANLVLETPAKKAEIAWINLKNTMMQLSQAALPALAKLGEALNILVKTTEDFQHIIKAVIAFEIAAWLIKVASAARITGTGVALLNASLGKTPVLLAAIAAWEIGQMIGKSGKNNWEQITKDQETALETMMENEARYTANIMEAERQKNASILTETQRVTSALALLANKNNEVYSNLSQGFVDSSKHVLDGLVKTYEQIVSELEKQASNHEANMEKYQDKLTKAIESAEDRQYDVAMSAGLKMSQLRDKNAALQNARGAAALRLQEASSEKERASISRTLDTQLKGIEKSYSAQASSSTKQQQLMEQSQRARAAANEAAKKLQTAVSEKDLDKVEKLLETGLKYAEKATQMAISDKLAPQEIAKRLEVEMGIRQQIIDVTQKQIDLEEKREKENVARLKLANDEAGLAKKAAADILGAMSPYKGKGAEKTLKTPEEQTEALRLAQTGFQTFIDLALAHGETLDITKMMGLATLGEKLRVFETQLPAIKVQLDLSLEHATQQLRDFANSIPAELGKKIQAAGGQLTPQGIQQTTKQLTEQIQITQKSMESASRSVAELKGTASQAAAEIELMYAPIPTSYAHGLTLEKTYQQELQKRVTTTKEYNDLLKEAQAAYKLDPTSPEGKLALKNLKQDLIDYNNKIKEHPELFTVKQIQDITQLETHFINIDTQLKKLKTEHPTFDIDTTKLQQSRTTLEEILNFYVKPMADELNRSKEGADALKNPLELLKSPAEGAASAVGTIDSNLSACIGTAGQLEQAMYAVAAAAQAATTAEAEASQYAATGGLIRHLAGGGTSGRGSDTIPAMLSPGEFVVNAGASRKFFSQLVAMNSGGNPVFRQGGGQSNITVGDINISNSSQPQATAREVISLIKRELRRETSSW